MSYTAGNPRGKCLGCGIAEESLPVSSLYESQIEIIPESIRNLDKRSDPWGLRAGTGAMEVGAAHAQLLRKRSHRLPALYEHSVHPVLDDTPCFCCAVDNHAATVARVVYFVKSKDWT